MELKGSKTEKNLMDAFAGESQARNKYTYFASKARKEGYEQIAAIFEETAKNEEEHAKIWFKYLNNGEVPTTVENLAAAAVGADYKILFISFQAGDQLIYCSCYRCRGINRCRSVSYHLDSNGTLPYVLTA